MHQQETRECEIEACLGETLNGGGAECRVVEPFVRRLGSRDFDELFVEIDPESTASGGGPSGELKRDLTAAAAKIEISPPYRDAQCVEQSKRCGAMNCRQQIHSLADTDTLLDRVFAHPKFHSANKIRRHLARTIMPALGRLCERPTSQVGGERVRDLRSGHESADVMPRWARCPSASNRGTVAMSYMLLGAVAVLGVVAFFFVHKHESTKVKR